MEYTTLGETGVRVSRLGFGGAAMGGYDYGTVRDDESVAAVHQALDAGVNFFDMADVYGFGHAEQVLGRALAGRRHQAVIATKFGVAWDSGRRTRKDSSSEWIRQAVDGSLKRLGVDRIDLYQWHWRDPVTPIADTIDALEQLRRAGKIRAVGVCNLTLTEIETAQRAGRLESIQLPFSVMEQSAGPVLRECRSRHAMSALTYNSLGHGLLAGRITATTRFEASDLRSRTPGFSEDNYRARLGSFERVRNLARRVGRSPAQVVLRWVAEQLPDAVVLAGMKRPDQVDDNCGMFGWTPGAEDMDELRLIGLELAGGAI